jgi:hypothetical protein
MARGEGGVPSPSSSLVVVAAVAGVFLLAGVILLASGSDIVRLTGICLLVFAISAVPTLYASRKASQARARVRPRRRR